MTTSSTNLQAERDDIAREFASAPQAQQNLLALLSEQTPPPADGSPPPMRRVVLAWRRSFTRYEAIAALRNAIYACELPGVTRLS